MSSNQKQPKLSDGQPSKLKRSHTFCAPERSIHLKKGSNQSENANSVRAGQLPRYGQQTTQPAAFSPAQQPVYHQPFLSSNPQPVQYTNPQPMYQLVQFPTQQPATHQVLQQMAHPIPQPMQQSGAQHIVQPGPHQPSVQQNIQPMIMSPVQQAAQPIVTASPELNLHQAVPYPGSDAVQSSCHQSTQSPLVVPVMPFLPSQAGQHASYVPELQNTQLSHTPPLTQAHNPNQPGFPFSGYHLPGQFVNTMDLDNILQATLDSKTKNLISEQENYKRDLSKRVDGIEEILKDFVSTLKNRASENLLNFERTVGFQHVEIDNRVSSKNEKSEKVMSSQTDSHMSEKPTPRSTKESDNEPQTVELRPHQEGPSGLHIYSHRGSVFRVLYPDGKTVYQFGDDSWICVNKAPSCCYDVLKEHLAYSEFCEHLAWPKVPQIVAINPTTTTGEAGYPPLLTSIDFPELPDKKKKPSNTKSIISPKDLPKKSESDSDVKKSSGKRVSFQDNPISGSVGTSDDGSAYPATTSSWNDVEEWPELPLGDSQYLKQYQDSPQGEAKTNSSLRTRRSLSPKPKYSLTSRQRAPALDHPEKYPEASFQRNQEKEPSNVAMPLKRSQTDLHLVRCSYSSHLLTKPLNITGKSRNIDKLSDISVSTPKSTVSILKRSIKDSKERYTLPHENIPEHPSLETTHKSSPRIQIQEPFPKAGHGAETRERKGLSGKQPLSINNESSLCGSSPSSVANSVGTEAGRTGAKVGDSIRKTDKGKQQGLEQGSTLIEPMNKFSDPVKKSQPSSKLRTSLNLKKYESQSFKKITELTSIEEILSVQKKSPSSKVVKRSLSPKDTLYCSDEKTNKRKSIPANEPKKTSITKQLETEEKEPETMLTDNVPNVSAPEESSETLGASKTTNKDMARTQPKELEKESSETIDKKQQDIGENPSFPKEEDITSQPLMTSGVYNRENSDSKEISTPSIHAENTGWITVGARKSRSLNSTKLDELALSEVVDTNENIKRESNAGKDSNENCLSQCEGSSTNQVHGKVDKEAHVKEEIKEVKSATKSSTIKKSKKDRDGTSETVKGEQRPPAVTTKSSITAKNVSSAKQKKKNQPEKAKKSSQNEGLNIPKSKATKQKNSAKSREISNPNDSSFSEKKKDISNSAKKVSQQDLNLSNLNENLDYSSSELEKLRMDVSEKMALPPNELQISIVSSFFEQFENLYQQFSRRPDGFFQP